MLNHIVLMGRLTRDPELRHTGSNVPVCSFSIACERDYSGGQTGEKVSDFIDIVAWRNTATFASKYLTKGRLVVVDGSLQIRTWTDKAGNKRRSAEIVADNIYFADSKRTGTEEPGVSNGAGSTYTIPTNPNEFASLEDSDADLPF